MQKAIGLWWETGEDLSTCGREMLLHISLNNLSVPSDFVQRAKESSFEHIFRQKVHSTSMDVMWLGFLSRLYLLSLLDLFGGLLEAVHQRVFCSMSGRYPHLALELFL